MTRTIMLAIVSTALIAGIILQSDAAFKASLQGLSIWWNIVFPGLLPYLVLFELIAAFGLTHAIGALLQPAATRLFKLPGEAALVLVLGWLGGHPLGSEGAAKLRKNNIVTQAQGQRLLALAHMPNPMFILVVIGSGFLHKPTTGIVITAAVWLSALWLLFILSVFSEKSTAPQIESNSINAIKAKIPNPSLLERSAFAMQVGRQQDGRSFGKALGDSITVSVQKLFAIGGYIIFAAVLAKLADPLISPLLAQLGLPFISQSLFEGHLGSYSASQWQAPGSSNGLLNAAAISAILAWSGLGSILQTSHAVSGTDLKLKPFITVRLLHALHAFCFTLLLWKPFALLLPSSLPALATVGESLSVKKTEFTAADIPSFWSYSIIGSLLLGVLIASIGAILLAYRKRASC